MRLGKGLLAEFETVDQLVRAAVELRKLGYRRLDAFTPYPVAAVERAIGLGRSHIPWIVFPCAMAGAAGAYLLQWWTNAVDYRLEVGGRPAHAPPAFVPITFEMGVLFAALSAVLALAVFSRLTTLWQPIFDVPGFERASVDRFFLAIDHADPAFDLELTAQRLHLLGAVRVELVGGGEP
ncbi:DUF3341 domain-containing protein [Polyangium aurulentum]|uniref:DUF3341 domain-containing protein n=1 Tax=Polyangium aurulentum TaxID=2567896 RepID=UPI0010AE00A6|nr:DUF3341 domain-containing protein [Polyangium aurulentum]UQA54572.1 DUF3341 domain-containing protein [Polyangium aurulentum]